MDCHNKNILYFKSLLLFSLVFFVMQINTFAQNRGISLHNKGNKKIIYSSDQKLMAIADRNEIQVLLSGGNIINNSFKTALSEINDVCFNAEGDKIFVVGKRAFGKNAVLLYEAKSGGLIKSIPVEESNLLAVAASRDGKQLAICSYNKMAMVFALETEKVLYQFKMKKTITTNETIE